MWWVSYYFYNLIPKNHVVYWEYTGKESIEKTLNALWNIVKKPATEKFGPKRHLSIEK